MPDEPRRQFNVYLPASLVRAFKHHAVDCGAHLSALAEQVIADHLARVAAEDTVGGQRPVFRGVTAFTHSEAPNDLAAFYARAFGREYHREGPNWNWFEFGPSRFALHRMPDSRPDPTAFHVDLVVTDVDSATARFRDAGGTVVRPVQDEAWGRSALVCDPEGRRLLLVEYER